LVTLALGQQPTAERQKTDTAGQSVETAVSADAAGSSTVQTETAAQSVEVPSDSAKTADAEENSAAAEDEPEESAASVMSAPDTAQTASESEELEEAQKEEVAVTDEDDEDGEAGEPRETLASAEEPQDTAAALRKSGVRLGILPLESLTGHNELASELTEAMALKLDSLGLYALFLPRDIESALELSAKKRMPNRCREPKCVHDIGKALGLDRVIYGTVDRSGSRVGVRITLIDVSINKPIESANVQGGDGVEAKSVLFHAVDLVHGHTGGHEMTGYFGPYIDNRREALWSTAAVTVTGTLYSLLNYGTSKGKSDGVYYMGYTKEKLSGVAASADQIPIFARPAALANAYVAASDDAYGVLYNPAGLAWVGQREAAAGYQHRFGLDLLALTYANKAARDLGFGQALLVSTDRDGAMTELYFVSAAGYKLNYTPIGPLSFGAAVKIISNSIKNLSPDSPKGQSIGAGLDMGIMLELSEKIRYGALLRGVPSVNRWKNETTGGQYYEAHPATLTMGGSYRAGYSSFFIAEGQIPLYEDQPWIMSGGIEYEIFRFIAVRVGLQRAILDEESNWWKITSGTGFRFDTEPLWGKSLNLDIAYEYNTLELFPVLNVSLRLGF
jgi:hypothetical protein